MDKIFVFAEENAMYTEGVHRYTALKDICNKHQMYRGIQGRVHVLMSTAEN